MGLMQRQKGKRYERAIADELRTQLPQASWRRSSQAERAHNPDVFAVGDPLLAALWLELQDARVTTPEKKLVQAEGDIATACSFGFSSSRRLAVAVTHKLGARTSTATMRLWVLAKLCSTEVPTPDLGVMVSMDFAQLVEIVKGALVRGVTA